MVIYNFVVDSVSYWEIGGLDMTIKELVKAVTEGDIKSVEVYEDYFQSWSKDKRNMFLGELTAKMVGELVANTRWEEFTYDRCRHCINYLKKKWDEEDYSETNDGTQQISNESTNTAKYPILKNLLNSEYESYVSFCGNLKRESDKIRLLFVILDGNIPNTYNDIKSFHEALSSDGFFMCKYKNFVSYYCKSGVEKIKDQYTFFKSQNKI